MSTLAPDLSNCTRLEIQYPGGALGYFFPSTSVEKGIFSDDEREHVRSFDTWVVSDRELIKAFARDVSRGVYSGELRAELKARAVRVTCYRGGDRFTSLTVYGRTVVSGDGRTFRYEVGSPDLSVLDPREIWSLRIRFTCALNLNALYTAGPLSCREITPYPAPDRWCDAIVEALRGQYFTYADWGDKKERSYSDARIAKMFICPSADMSTKQSRSSSETRDDRQLNEPVGEWRSNYAMNPDCKRDSPPDTVLLFEASHGWNQHGGPELFTLDDHNPKGGLVLFNDGNVTFIRTEEELKQLRWN
jgi:hypothetical protein